MALELICKPKVSHMHKHRREWQCYVHTHPLHLPRHGRPVEIEYLNRVVLSYRQGLFELHVDIRDAPAQGAHQCFIHPTQRDMAYLVIGKGACCVAANKLPFSVQDKGNPALAVLQQTTLGQQINNHTLRVYIPFLHIVANSYHTHTTLNHAQASQHECMHISSLGVLSYKDGMPKKYNSMQS